MISDKQLKKKGLEVGMALFEITEQIAKEAKEQMKKTGRDCAAVSMDAGHFIMGVFEAAKIKDLNPQQASIACFFCDQISESLKDVLNITEQQLEDFREASKEMH